MGQGQCDLFTNQTVQQMRQVSERIAHVQHLGAQILLTGKCQQLADQRSSTVGVLVDLGQVAIIAVPLIVA